MLRLKGHKGEVCATASCSGKVCTAGHDKTLFIWDPSITGGVANNTASDGAGISASNSSTDKTSMLQLVHKFKEAHEHIISCLGTCVRTYIWACMCVCVSVCVSLPLSFTPTCSPPVPTTTNTTTHRYIRRSRFRTTSLN